MAGIRVARSRGQALTAAYRRNLLELRDKFRVARSGHPLRWTRRFRPPGDEARRRA